MTDIRVTGGDIFAQPLTVQIGYYEDEEFIVEECNHAGAEDEEVTNLGGSFWEYDLVVQICDKCGALNDPHTDNGWSGMETSSRLAGSAEISGAKELGACCG